MEIPTQPDEAGLLNLSQSRRMDFIVWMDYTSSHPEKSFGLLDEETNCYIELPAEWEGNLKLTDSEEYDGAVELRTVDEDELVLTVRLARTSATPPAGQGSAWWRPASCRPEWARTFCFLTQTTAFPRRCIC